MEYVTFILKTLLMCAPLFIVSKLRSQSVVTTDDWLSLFSATYFVFLLALLDSKKR